jgi:hypothetical protein
VRSDVCSGDPNINTRGGGTGCSTVTQAKVVFLRGSLHCWCSNLLAVLQAYLSAETEAKQLQCYGQITQDMVVGRYCRGKNHCFALLKEKFLFEEKYCIIYFTGYFTSRKYMSCCGQDIYLRLLLKELEN